MNKEKGWINIQKQIYGKFVGKMSFIENFKYILVQKTLRWAYLILICP